jgi:hypothetical protein
MVKTPVSKLLQKQGYTILQGPHTIDSSWGNTVEEKLEEFQKSWNDLPADNFLSDGGHYRYRRYSVFNWSNTNDKLTLLPHEPHYQSTYRNNMNGGINRDFKAFKKNTLKNPILERMVSFVSQQISFKNEKQWRIQAHQFRIEANKDEAGQPTPEGIHRDGADFILIMVLKRHNITGGVNHIYDAAKRLVFGGILENTGDAILIDDRKVWHGVSEVYPDGDNSSCYRDVLVLTFHNEVNK